MNVYLATDLRRPNPYIDYYVYIDPAKFLYDVYYPFDPCKSTTVVWWPPSCASTGSRRYLRRSGPS